MNNIVIAHVILITSHPDDNSGCIFKVQSDILFTTQRSERSALLFHPTIFSFFISHKTATDGEDGGAAAVESVHPSQEPTLLITGVCTSLCCMCPTLAREVPSSRNVRLSRFLSKSPAFLTRIILSDLPFPLLLQLKIGQLDQFVVSRRCFASHPRSFSGSG